MELLCEFRGHAGAGQTTIVAVGHRPFIPALPRSIRFGLLPCMNSDRPKLAIDFEQPTLTLGRAKVGIAWAE